MFWIAESILTELIVVCSMVLFGYWVLRATLFATATQAEIDRVLESDLQLARRF